MRYTLVVLVLALAAAVAPWSAVAEDCTYHNYKIDVDSFAFLDEPIAPYDLCWEFTKVVGTINGRNVTCVFFAELCGPMGCIGRTSDEIWGDGWTDVRAWKFYTWYETNSGVLETRDWSWIDADSGNETGFTKVIGGDGAFAGASGYLSYSPDYPNRLDTFRFKGHICTE